MEQATPLQDSQQHQSWHQLDVAASLHLSCLWPSAWKALFVTLMANLGAMCTALHSRNFSFACIHMSFAPRQGPYTTHLAVFQSAHAISLTLPAGPAKVPGDPGLNYIMYAGWTCMEWRLGEQKRSACTSSSSSSSFSSSFFSSAAAGAAAPPPPPAAGVAAAAAPPPPPVGHYTMSVGEPYCMLQECR